MSVRSRVAFASGASAAVGSALLLSGRLEGSVVLAFFLAFAVRTAPAAALSDAGPILAGGAMRSLRQRALLAPAWGLAVAAAVWRAGSVELADLRGAHAVAGLALAHGPVLTVAGSWLALGAVALATLARTPLGVRTASAEAPGVVKPPVTLRRLEMVGVAAEVVLAVSLFAGPQIDGVTDAVWWVLGFVALAGAAGLLLMLTGGAP